MISDTQAVQILHNKVKKFPGTVVVLGSGWNKVVDDLIVESEIPYSELFGVEAKVPGHQGKLIIAKFHKKRVAFMAGRFHMYEGFSAREATAPIRVFSQVGMKTLILTAACGALNEKYKVGDFIITSDLLTLFLALDNPLIGPQFVDMSSVFDENERQKAIQICVQKKIPYHEGVYAYYHGPNFETPADKMALRFLGADVVGMSTVPETIQARSYGIKVLSLAFVTNLAFVIHDHKEVLAEANKASTKMKTILQGILT